MFSWSTRLGVVLLALAQLCVWGVYAPVHRLSHHSALSRKTSQPAPVCKTHCCSHHHSERSAPAESESSHGLPSPCPDDDQHCGLCVLALHAGCAADIVELTGTIECVDVILSLPGLQPATEVARPFDSRGPPTS